MDFDRESWHYARGESTTNLGPGKGLDGPAVDVREPPVDLSRPSSLRVLVYISFEPLEQRTRERRTGLGRERQRVLQDLRGFPPHRPDFSRQNDAGGVKDAVRIATRSQAQLLPILTSEGEQGGEQGPARGVPPFLRIQLSERHGRFDAAGLRILPSNFNRRCDLLNGRVGRRSAPPASPDAVGEAGQWQYRGVSDQQSWG